MVHQQADVGLDVIDDGDFDKTDWLPYIAERLDGHGGVGAARADGQVGERRS